MKNLLISKSFSYEIVDFTLLWQSNTYHLGDSCYIHLTKRTDLMIISSPYFSIIPDVMIIATVF